VDPDGYAALPARINEIATRLQAHADDAVAADTRDLLDLVEEYHRTGLTRLVEMIQQWRGEIFLEAVDGDPVTGTLLRGYGLPREP
jgi:hypothetical protein